MQLISLSVLQKYDIFNVFDRCWHYVVVRCCILNHWEYPCMFDTESTARLWLFLFPFIWCVSPCGVSVKMQCRLSLWCHVLLKYNCLCCLMGNAILKLLFMTVIFNVFVCVFLFCFCFFPLPSFTTGLYFAISVMLAIAYLCATLEINVLYNL